MMEDDQEICRVCRCESTPDHPLFHPCKCSGSIRFVHQDCLLEWLSHSKKQYCELCEYPFMFTPIYRDDMPDRIPIKVVLRQCIQRSSALLWMCFRAGLVATVWLVILPILTLYIWRFYFWTGESIGFAESRVHHLNNINETIDNTVVNGTLAEQDSPESSMWPFDINWFLSECFEGQIITAFVIVVFVAAYLFREWVIQHTPMDTGIDVVDEEPGMMDQPLIQDPTAQDALFNMVRNIQPDERADVQQPLMRQEFHDIFDRFNGDNDHRSYASGSEDTEPTYDDDWRERSRHESEDDDQNRDGDYEENGRQPFLASWRDEHDRRDASSSNVRWRAPEFTAAASEYGLPPPYYATEGSPSNSNNSEDLRDDNNARTTDIPEQPQPQPEEHQHQNQHQPQLHQEHNDFPRWEDVAPGRPPVVPVHDQWDNENDNQDAEMDDDEPFDIREDIEGVLEAIGMRGSMWMLVQNSILMCLMITLCLGVAVWIPYIIGRLVISIPRIEFIRTPIAVLRYIPDHVVDLVLDFGVPYLQSKTTRVGDLVPEQIRAALDTLQPYLTKIMNTIQSDTLEATAAASGAASTLDTTAATNQTISWGMHVVAVQDKIGTIGSMVLDRWFQFALGQTGLDRSVCILMGYMVLIFVGSSYLARSGRITHNDTGNNLNDMIRQQGVFLKVFFFIVLELVLFPTVCGILIDLASLPLFEDATTATRWAFFAENPYSSTFLHWFVGTGFMFHFAVFITLIREVVRSGVMWFIRDPNDPQFNPVQEMVERSVLTLIRKIGASALMYCTLIVAGIGSVTFVVSRWTGIYPLRWSYDAPLSTLSLDLLAVQFLIPPLVSYIKPRELSKKMFTEWCLVASRQLRLSSFMFDLRYSDEEGTHVRRTFKAWILRQKAPIPSDVFSDVAINEDDGAPVIFRRDGNLARVPRHDSVPVPDNRRMIVPVDPVTLEPLDENERRLGHPAASESGDIENNTMIVYIPPHFRLRIMAFAFLIWLSCSMMTCMVTVVPILVGRHVFDLYLTSEVPVHDFYSFMVGAYVMVFLSIVINWVSHKYDAFSASTTTQDGEQQLHRIHLMTLSPYLKEKAQQAFKATFLAVVIGFVLPLVLGIAVDMYIFMPIRYSKSNDALVIHVSEDWSLGVVYLSIIVGLVNIFPENALQRFLNNVLGNNLMQANMSTLVRSLVVPVMLGTTASIVIPGLLALASIRILGINDDAMKVALFRCAYPVVFCLAIVVGAILLGARFARLWLDEVRDATYLIGKRLHNLEERATADEPS